MDQPQLSTHQAESASVIPAKRRPGTTDVTSAKSVATGLAPWSPSGDDQWDARKAAHLLRRAGFGVAPDELKQALAASPDQVVSALLDAASLPSPEPPGAWVSQQPFSNPGNAEQQQYLLWARSLQEWWFTLMTSPGLGLREKMVLFWHNHFTSELLVVYVAQYFYKQNDLFRNNAFGNFRTLATRITTDPCMLVYLDLGLSKAGNPNENYPRELLELFTLGEGAYEDGTPHYTEADIVELSRALTGWTVEGLESRFRSTRFDNGQKTIFGEKANFGLGSVGDRDVIELIFDQDDHDHNRKRAAIFLCSKLYRWFVYNEPDMNIVQGMADTLIANNWEVGPVLHQLLTSAHFFSEDVMGAMLKSPADYVAGSMREFGFTPDRGADGVIQGRPETYDPITAMSALAQTLLAPPNVKGWPGGRNWISSVTTPQRIRLTESWIAPISGARDYHFNPSWFVDAAPERDDVHGMLERMLVILLPLPVSDQAKESLLATLLGGGKDYEWDPDHPSTAIRLKSTLVEIVRLAEYQLM